MILWVVERALAARNLDRVIVATDDQRIQAVVAAAGHEVMMTRADHASGADRLAEVAADLTGVELVVNVQGDEPLISPLTIERAVDAMSESGIDAEITTTWEAIDSAAEVLNPNVVKIVVGDRNQAIYFSRAPVPYPRDAVNTFGSLAAALEGDRTLLAQFKKHTGLYVYRRDVLLAFTQWPQTQMEKTEGLEQLRALDHGVKIKAVEAASTSIGVDSVADLERVRSLMEVRGSRAKEELAV